MLEDLTGHDDVGHLVTEGEGHRIGPDGEHTVTRGHAKGRPRKVDSHVTMGVEVRGEKPTPAADVHNGEAAPGGTGDQVRP